jgi:3-hydroxyisobutyrate dehydrogenase-like beta-hydroxyacid dehydrogenase
VANRVLTSLAGRSGDTVARARGVFEDAGGLEDLVRVADVILLVVPPGAARAAGDALAAACEATGARPLTAEMDAVSPDTVRAVAERLPGDLVDGAISGPPPRPDAPTPTRVFLSGARAGDVAALDAPGVRWIVLDGPVGAASAAKMCTASVRKGYQALLAQALVTADAHGVLHEVLADLRLDFPDAGVASAATAATKAWRFSDEMTEIAATQEAAGLPRALGDGLAETYRFLATSEWALRRPDEVPSDLDDPSGLRPRRTGREASDETDRIPGQ